MYVYVYMYTYVYIYIYIYIQLYILPNISHAIYTMSQHTHTFVISQTGGVSILLAWWKHCFLFAGQIISPWKCQPCTYTAGIVSIASTEISWPRASR